MSYQIHETDDAVVLAPKAPVDAAVIWLHGLGADGYDFVPIVEELRLPPQLGLRFIFPHARPRPVTINNGYVMRAWYDIKALTPERMEDAEGIRESQTVVQQYIERETAAGIPAARILIAGFSQGGVIALQTGLRYSQRLAGILVLSAGLSLRDTLPAEAAPANRDVPILICHGSQDPVVPMAFGVSSRDLLQTLGYPVEWRSYPMAHQVCPQEIADIAAWLQARLK
jgi:phospholipase/carboxylesterase